MALTTQQIHQTADELHERGIKPTLAEVRKALGGGSFTTISDAMKSWRQEHKEEQQLQQIELPSNINERLQILGAEIWQTAIDIANDRLAKERDALEVVKAKAQQEVDEYAESVRTLETEQAELLQQLDSLQKESSTAKADAEKAQKERDELEKELTETNHQLELKNSELKGELKAITAERDELKKELKVNSNK